MPDTVCVIKIPIINKQTKKDFVLNGGYSINKPGTFILKCLCFYYIVQLMKKMRGIKYALLQSAKNVTI